MMNCTCVIYFEKVLQKSISIHCVTYILHFGVLIAFTSCSSLSCVAITNTRLVYLFMHNIFCFVSGRSIVYKSQAYIEVPCISSTWAERRNWWNFLTAHRYKPSEYNVWDAELYAQQCKVAAQNDLYSNYQHLFLEQLWNSNNFLLGSSKTIL